MICRWFFLMIAVVLIACAATPPPEDHFYRLPVPAARDHQALTDGSLRVEPFQASGLQFDRAIVYTHAGNSVELKQYHYHYWHLPPEQLIQKHLADYLKSAAAASRVTTTRGTPVELIVGGRIDELLHVRGQGDGEVVVSLELRLSRPGQRAPLLLKQYTVRQPVPAGSMERVVTGFGQALAELYADFLADARRINRTDLKSDLDVFRRSGRNGRRAYCTAENSILMPASSIRSLSLSGYALGPIGSPLTSG